MKTSAEILEKHLADNYRQVGLSADWCCTAYQVSAQTVLFDLENRANEWCFISSWICADDERHFDGDGRSKAMTLTKAIDVLAELEKNEWQCDLCEAEAEDIAVANGFANLKQSGDE